VGLSSSRRSPCTGRFGALDELEVLTCVANFQVTLDTLLLMINLHILARGKSKRGTAFNYAVKLCRDHGWSYQESIVQ
jgi:hypothetical protein